MFERIGRLTTTYPRAVCLAWVVAGAVLHLAAPNWDSKALDDDIHFLPARCASVRGYQLLEKAFPQDVFASRAIFAVERDTGPLNDDDYALVDQFVSDLTLLRQEAPELRIGSIASYRDPLIGRRLTSADQRCTLIQMGLGTPFLALQTRATIDRAEERLQQRVKEMGPRAPRLLATGPAGLGRDLIRASGDSLNGTTLATVILVVIILLIVYRAPLLALVPLATIAVSVWVALRLLALTTLLPGVHLVNISKVFAVVILYGAGTDYCLFLISRYREELSARGWGKTSAIQRSVAAVGGALTASAGTVICGLGLMGFAEFAKVRCAGPAIALSLAVALLASLTLAPALLQLLGRAVFWPTRRPRPPRRLEALPASDGLWERISRRVLARPALVWTISILLLLPLAIIGFRVTPNYKSTGELPPSAASVKGVQAIQRHFTAGEIGPSTVLLVSGTDWNSPAGRDVVAHLSHCIALLPNVAEVRSLTQPLGTPVTSPAPVIAAGLLQSVQQGFQQATQQAASQMARRFYVAELAEEQQPQYVTRLDVVFHSDPFDAASFQTLDLVQTLLAEDLPFSAKRLSGVQTECYGVTVNAHDIARITDGDRVRVNLLVLGGVFLILLVLVRRIWLAAYLLVTVLFSYYATLGATVLAGMLRFGRPLTEVEWRVPFFLFTILVAVGEDYNILLITRVLQERSRRGLREGIQRALARTGGTITSCGLIMAGTFATLMLAGLGTLVQIGFALAFGILLDTFVVRPFLVPAFILLVWREKSPKEAAPTTVLPFPTASRLAG
jgi:RND superfamily putative drug exporter